MILLIIILFLWLELVVTTLPLFLISLLIMLIIHSAKPDTRLYLAMPGAELSLVWAFLGGLILDASAARFLGGSSLFFVSWLFLILLYQRKYEIATIPFILASSFFGALLYFWIFGFGEIFIQAGVSSIVAVLLFIMLRVRSAPQNLQFS